MTWLPTQSGVFVAGTDTHVGKTVVAAALLVALRQYVNAAPMKPVQTGAYIKNNTLISPDLEFVLRTARMSFPKAVAALASPYCFRKACSPHLAAAFVNRRISGRRILRAAAQLYKRYDFLVVEGAGGILVPVNRSQTMLDVIAMLKFPVLVVARPGLGTLNHTFLTLRALSAENIPVVGIVLSDATRHWSEIERNNQETLADATGLPTVRFPFCASAKRFFLSSRDLSRCMIALTPILQHLQLPNRL